MSDLHTVLVVEDNEINRTILLKILSEEYQVIFADHGVGAFDIMQTKHSEIAAIILDIVMPVMNGHEFLGIVSKDEKYKNIPIIVTTGYADRNNELKALELGAWDFVTKPFDPKILKFRLKNVIDRSQLAAFNQLKYLAEYDDLTGIYNKNKFFQESGELLKENVDVKFVVVRLDINRFSLINDFFGNKEGNRLLKYIADHITMFFDTQRKCVFGRIESDVFGMCIALEHKDQIYYVLDRIANDIKSYHINFDVVPTFGIYEIEDHDMPVDRILDRANLAAKQCKGNYIKNYAFYDDAMGKMREKEQEIINEMNEALETNQFVLYLQPKCSLLDHSSVGAEALVRWLHPKKGMIMPNEFIPIFESNGFITKLDFYVWEQACILIKKQLDTKNHAMPISVNVSRVNIYSPNFVSCLCKLTEKYQVPTSLLHLELTESAYTDNPQIMKDTIKRLQSKGFIIMMDDFGSGYSSLNILKDISVDVLKIDMRFLSDTEKSDRGRNILESVVRMAKWLSIPTVVEGVETKEQVDFLTSIGCEYVQGYYFARPMPQEVYEKLCENYSDTNILIRNNLESPKPWILDSQIEQMLVQNMHAVALYEVTDSKIDILRANNLFYEIFGYSEKFKGLSNPMKLYPDNYKQNIFQLFQKAIQTKAVVKDEFELKIPIEDVSWVRVKVRYLNTIGNRHILLGMIFDISEQKRKETDLGQNVQDKCGNQIVTNRILIIDDSSMKRTVLRNIFDDKFEILEAENGQQGLQILEENGYQIDIILLDLMMPIMNGLEFLKEKKKVEELFSTPVIIITANENKEQELLALHQGATDYITSPFIKETVIHRVNNVLETNQRFVHLMNEYRAVSHKAKTDSLTGLYNRVTVKKVMKQALNYSENQHAMVMIDIDDFKNINDMYGHTYGDLVLMEVSVKFRKLFREHDTVARLGGDEFCVFMKEIPSVELVWKCCNLMCKEMSQMVIEPYKAKVSCSVGIAISSNTLNTFEKLYESADIALYESKRRGKSRVFVFGKEEIVS